jgi:hypothetical protein
VNKKLRVLALVTFVAFAGAVSWHLFGPKGGGGRVTGQVVGGVDSTTVVLVVDSPAGVSAQAVVQPDGRFEVLVPPGALQPWVVIDTRRGALVQSMHPIDPLVGDALRPLAVWETDLRGRREGRRVRFDWSPIPTGREGFPAKANYSLVVSYERVDATMGEVVFTPIVGPVYEVDIDQDLLPYMPQLDPSKPEVGMILRATDPEDAGGPMWIGNQVRWRIDTCEMRRSVDTP